MRWVVIAASAALVGLLAYGLASNRADTSIDDAIVRGDRVAAPAAKKTLPRLGGSGVASLADYAGKVVVVNFWASWCPPCVDELPILQRAHSAIERRGGLVLGINTRDASEDALTFVERFKLTFPSIRDGSGDFSETYGLTGYPETFVLDRKGRIAALRRGPVTDEWLNETLPPLLSEEA